MSAGRRLLSAVVSLIVGVAAVLPMLGEVLQHRDDGVTLPGRHIEAQTTVHHGDRCLLDSFSSNPGTLAAEGAGIEIRMSGPVRCRVVVPTAPAVRPTRPPLPRAPPSIV